MIISRKINKVIIADKNDHFGQNCPIYLLISA